MRALTLYQPWASAIAWGLKSIETRSWSTSYRGPIAVHAGLTLPKEGRALLDRWLAGGLKRLGVERLRAEGLPRGAIVAVVELVDVVRTETLQPGPIEYSLGDYTVGRYGWKLSRVRRLVVPIPTRGAMGLWTLDADTAAAVVASNLEEVG